MKPLYEGKARRPCETEQTGECLMESTVKHAALTRSATRLHFGAHRSAEPTTGEDFEEARSHRASSQVMESHAEVLKRAQDAVHS